MAGQLLGVLLGTVAVASSVVAYLSSSERNAVDDEARRIAERIANVTAQAERHLSNCARGQDLTCWSWLNSFTVGQTHTWSLADMRGMKWIQEGARSETNDANLVAVLRRDTTTQFSLAVYSRPFVPRRPKTIGTVLSLAGPSAGFAAGSGFTGASAGSGAHDGRTAYGQQGAWRADLSNYGAATLSGGEVRIVGMVASQTVCHPDTEIRTKPGPNNGCPENHTGTVREIRTFDCLTSEWGAWQDLDNPATACTCIPTTEVVSVTSCPIGQVGQITSSRNFVCDTPGGRWLLPYESQNTCVPACYNTTRDIDVGCPSGQTGAHMQRQTHQCPNGVGTSPASTGFWGAGTTLSNTCHPACYNTTLDVDLGCPAGHIGGNIIRQTYQCPGGVGTSWASTGYWDSGVPVSNTCTPACYNNVYDWDAGCPSGQVGAHWRRVRFECPGGVGISPASTGYWNWGGAWTTSNSCVPACVPTNETTTGSCPSGQSGVINYRRDYACPSGSVGWVV